MPSYFQLPDEQIAAVKAEAARQAQAQGISSEQALWNYAQSQGMDANQVDAMMGFAPGSSNKWLSQQGGQPAAQPAMQTPQPAAQALQPAPQGNTYKPPAQAAQPAQAAPAAQAALTSNSTPQEIADSYRAWSNQNGGNTTANQTTAGNYLLNLGIGQSSIDNAVGIYQAATPQPSQPSIQQASPQYNPQQNPYLGQMGKDIGNQMFDQWSRNTLPSIRSGAVANGGFGGSRQGVVEANGINDMNRQYGQALTSMYGNDWSNQQNRNLQATSTQNQYNLGLGQLNNQAQSTQNQYDLGLRSNDLGFAGLDANIYQNNFNNQVTGANLGLNAYNALNNSNAGGTAAAGTAQNQPLNYFNNSSDKTNSVANGYGSSTSSQTNPGNPMLGALGGAQLGSQLYNQYMGSQVQDNGYSTGTGSAYAGTTNSAGVWSPNRAGM